MKPQSVLSMYSYGATTGVIGSSCVIIFEIFKLNSIPLLVDIGDRIDVVPIDQGYTIDKGLNKFLAENRLSFMQSLL